MPKYMFQASYTLEGVNGLLKVGGSSREKAIGETIESVGGNMEAFYYAFGEDDIYLIAELPDNEAATAISLQIGAKGAITIKTTVLLDPATIDEASKRAVSYTPPGG